MAAIVALFTCVLSLSSCSSDDEDNDSNSVVGEWALAEASSSQVLYGDLVLNANGTFNSTVFTFEGNNLIEASGAIATENIVSMKKQVENGSFTVSNGKIAFTINGKTESYDYSISTTTKNSKTYKTLIIKTSSRTIQLFAMDDQLKESFNTIDMLYEMENNSK